MRSSLTIARLAGACAVIAFSVCAIADDTSVAKAAIQARYDSTDRAWMKKDVKGIVADLAPDFKMTDKKGAVHNRAEAVAMVKQQIQFISKFISVKDKIVSFKLVKGGAKVVSTGKLVAVIEAQGQKGKLEATSESVDLWVKSGSKWLLKASKETKSTISVNGRQIPN